MSRRVAVVLALLFGVGLLWLADLWLGPEGFAWPHDLLGLGAKQGGLNFTMREIRLPRASAAVLAGVGLAVAGLEMQTVFRNPLAGPYVLGISAGASLGVALLLLGSVVLGTGLHSGAWWVLVLAAIGGALALMVVVLWVSLRVQNNVSLLVLGVLFGGAVGSLVGLLQYFSTPLALKQFVLWTMGSLHGVDLEQLGWFLGMIAVGLVPVLFSIRSLNLMLLPDLDAQSLGLRLKVGRTWVLVSAGVLAGGVTGFVGPIGFVGLVAPHLARYALRTQNHRWLVPASALMGAMLLLAGDILSMLPGGGKVLPINSVTSLMGVPLVIFFWWKSRNVFQ